VNDAEQAAILGDRERRAAILGDLIGNRLDFAAEFSHGTGLQRADGISGRHGLRRAAVDIIKDRIDRALADRGSAGIDTAHPGLRHERNEVCVQFRHVAAADAVFLFCQHDD
jgi:hypothetical protein